MGLVEILEDHLKSHPDPEVDSRKYHMTHTAKSEDWISPFEQDPSLIEELPKYFSEMRAAPGDTLFGALEPVDRLYFIEKGVVDLMIPDDELVGESERLLRISAGGMCGELGFFLERPQVFAAKVVHACKLWTITRQSFQRMRKEKPQLCIGLQTALIRSLCLTESQKLEGAHELKVHKRSKVSYITNSLALAR